MNIDVIRLIVFVAGFLAMLCVEGVFSVRAWSSSRVRRILFHAGLMGFNILILRFSAVAALLWWRQKVYNAGWGLWPIFGVGAAGEIIGILIVLDVFNYWWHRLSHRVGFLWRFHKVHHVDTHVDVSTSLRFHPGELFISAFVKAIWVVLLGPSVLAFAIFESGISLAAQFHHSNIDFSDKIEQVIRKVIVTPRFHAAHHTVNRRTGDNNFSTIFIFWDKLFGTYREPDYKEMEQLGLPGGRESYLEIGATLKGPFTKEY